MSDPGAAGAIAAARLPVERAIADRIFPGASLEVGSSTSPLWSEALGGLTFDRESPPTRLDTCFDLASLTKVIATTTILMDLVGKRRLPLDARVGEFFGEWRGEDRSAVTVRDLLEHASGLPARLVDAPPATRREFEHEICRTALEYTPRTRTIYSDLDFILLGFLAADLGHARLSTLLEQIIVRLKPDTTSGAVRLKPDTTSLTFDLAPEFKKVAAPTQPLPDDARRGRTLWGEVHDNYAASLGGVAGHAGLFGTAPAVGVFARAILRAARGDASLPPPFSPPLIAQFTTRSTVPASSRALGWDTMLPTSSCGEHMSRRAFGHVGFTGTSLWIDPDRDRYFVLLTNRAYGGGTLDEMRALRRAFHDSLGAL